MPVRSLSILALVIIGASPALAGDVETRVYNVQVDGKPAGEFRLSVRTADDGTENVTATAAVQVKSLLGGYRYSYRGSEVWKNGRLQRFESSSDDNGKRHTVAAEATKGGMRLTVDGVTRAGRLDVWPTTYWRFPPNPPTGRTVALLDADTGDEQTARTDAAGEQTLTVAGKPLPCARVAIAGPTTGTLLYDGRGRLVSQETTEDGHKTVLTLREIQR